MMKDRNVHLNYDVVRGTHGSAEEEWAPHNAQTDSFTEWHYWTSVLEGTNGHRYFLFLCDFQFAPSLMQSYLTNSYPSLRVPEDKMAYMFQTILADHTAEHFVSDVDVAFMEPKDAFNYETRNQQFRGQSYTLDMSYKGDNFLVSAQGPKFHVDLSARGGNRVMWAKDSLGVDGLIRQGAEKDRSFYYSLPDLPFSGTLSYEKNGEWITTEVTGRGWIDRQWGDFTTKAWEWSSLRFADGDRINLYNFQGGYQVGTYQKADGRCDYFGEFTVYQNGYAKTPDGTWFSHGWEYELPVKDKKYRVKPLSDKSIMVAPGNSFFEGAGQLFDESGQQVGWSVNESMDVRVMENAPYKRFQNNQPFCK